MTLAYVAHPIDQARTPVEIDQLVHALVGQGFNVYMPRDGWRLPNPGPEHGTIARVNRTAQAGADVTVAYLPEGVATLGVPSEIERALSMGQPVLLYTDVVSVQITAWADEGAFVGAAARVGRAGEQVREVLAQFGGAPPATVPDLRVVLEASNAQAPTRNYEGDAGFDLYATRSYTIKPGQYVEVQTDVRVGLPPGVWAMLVGRSSTAAKGLSVNPAVIDNGFTGKMWFGCTNVSKHPVEVEVGDRLAQLIPLPLLAPALGVREVDALAETDRSSRGLGSSGR